MDRGNLSFTDFLTIVLHPLKCLLKGRKHSIGGKALLTLCSCWRHRKCLFFVCFLIWSSLTFEVFVEYRNICFHPHRYWFKPSRNFTSKIDLFCPESLGRSRLVTSAAALTLLLLHCRFVVTLPVVSRIPFSLMISLTSTLRLAAADELLRRTKFSLILKVSLKSSLFFWTTFFDLCLSLFF